jgi:ribosomal protein S18 acetylase RimI-like enzyme
MNSLLRPAKLDDLSTILRWIPDVQACLLWAGPKVRYPATAESVWEDIVASEENAFCLGENDGNAIGFGQILLPESRVAHLARIIIDPAKRGGGHGRFLCLRLMGMAVDRYSVLRFTLNVYQTNVAALSLYRSLGFTERIQQDFEGVLSMSMLAEDY